LYTSSPDTLYNDSIFFTNLIHKFFILMHLLHSSTCFEHYCALLQEDNSINTASGTVRFVGFGNSMSAQFITDDTRCGTNTIFPPEDEHNNARNMYRSKINVLK